MKDGTAEVPAVPPNADGTGGSALIPAVPADTSLTGTAGRRRRSIIRRETSEYQESTGEKILFINFYSLCKNQFSRYDS